MKDETRIWMSYADENLDVSSLSLDHTHLICAFKISCFFCSTPGCTGSGNLLRSIKHRSQNTRLRI